MSKAPNFDDLATTAITALSRSGWSATGMTRAGFWSVTQLAKGKDVIEIWTPAGRQQSRVWLSAAKGGKAAEKRALSDLEAANVIAQERRERGVLLGRARRNPPGRLTWENVQRTGMGRGIRGYRRTGRGFEVAEIQKHDPISHPRSRYLAAEYRSWNKSEIPTDKPWIVRLYSAPRGLDGYTRSTGASAHRTASDAKKAAEKILSHQRGNPPRRARRNFSKTEHGHLMGRWDIVADANRRAARAARAAGSEEGADMANRSAIWAEGASSSHHRAMMYDYDEAMEVAREHEAEADELAAYWAENPPRRRRARRGRRNLARARRNPGRTLTEAARRTPPALRRR